MFYHSIREVTKTLWYKTPHTAGSRSSIYAALVCTPHRSLLTLWTPGPTICYPMIILFVGHLHVPDEGDNHMHYLTLSIGKTCPSPTARETVKHTCHPVCTCICCQPTCEPSCISLRVHQTVSGIVHSAPSWSVSWGVSWGREADMGCLLAGLYTCPCACFLLPFPLVLCPESLKSDLL